MKIIVDAFGGDNAPNEVIKGAKAAIDDFNVSIGLSGSTEKIKKACAELGIDSTLFEIIEAPDVFDIHEEPTKLLKEGKNTSMAVGLAVAAETEDCAFVSAGSTGALIAGATFITKRIKGIKRVALAPVLPSAKGRFLLLDAGANTENRPEQLLQFAVMGSAYMQAAESVAAPKIGLLNIGSEDTKGRDLEREAYKLLTESDLDFYGNLEAREMPFGACDVVVTDGFTGNIALKLYEGMGSYFAKTLKGILGTGAGKLAGLMVLPKINDFKKKMDYRETGGGLVLGASKAVIKAHGSSDARAFYNAIRQGKLCIENKMTEKIAAGLDR
ncbi:MAG: phosphate acyltransferase PlsX [Ruminococcus sp.]|jgi:glycerol-3-phosphate acyltransferase PlsX|nr:phosphate acyltransferase PlsX [Ruminococcus sp.]